MGAQRVLSLVADKSGDCQRASARNRVLLSALLVTTTDEYRVRLRDLSATGAKVEGERLPPLGKDVLLKRGRREIFARIVWAGQDQAGLEFDPPLGGEVLDEINPPPGPPPEIPPEAYKRPGLRCRPLTPEEHAMGEAWARPAAKSPIGQ